MKKLINIFLPGILLSMVSLPGKGDCGRAAPPLLKNGDFETGAAGGASRGKLPEGWVKPYGAAWVLELDAQARPGSKGKQCLKIDTNEKVRSGGAYSKPVPLGKGQGISVSGWVRPGHAKRGLRGLYFGVGWYDANLRPMIARKGTSVNYVYVYRKEKRGDWYRMHTLLTPATAPKDNYTREIPPGTAFFDIRVFALNYPGPGWFDDIEVKVLPASEIQKKLEKEAARKRKPAGAGSQLSTNPNATWLTGYIGSTKAREAAEVLATYLGKVTGQESSALAWQPNKAGRAFVVTDAAHAPATVAQKLKGKRRDAFVIQYPVRMDGRDVCVMVAQDEEGMDRPVYFFLTKFLDVHWVGPGELGEVYRAQPDWKVPEKVQVVENPDYEMRHWYSPTFRCRQWLAAGVRMSFHHALGHVFDPRKHGDTPEVYPLVDGKRTIPKLKGGLHALSGWQPCTGNPKSVEIAVKYVLDGFEKHPEMATQSLSVNDGAGNICECDLCRAQDAKDAFREGQRPNLSDRFFRFYNTVIQRAMKKNPNARIAVLGYGAVRSPPTEIKVDPHIYVFHVSPSVEDLKGWKAAGAIPNLYLWLWDGGFLTIRPDLDTVTELIRAAHDLGGIGLYSECIPHWVISAPKFYVIAHLLWDTTQDPHALLSRYCRLAYGNEAGKQVQSFLERWYAIYRRRPGGELYRTSWGWRSAEQFQYLEREDLAFFDKALVRAQRAALSEKQKKRLEYLVNYYELMRINGEEYLAGKELANPHWLASQSKEDILAAAERTSGLTPIFNRLYRERVLEDRSGWMLDSKYSQDPEAFWNRFVAQMRNMVSSSAQTAMDKALTYLTEKMLGKLSKEVVIAEWKKQVELHPALAGYIGPQIRRLEGVRFENIVTNGEFENGEPGNPPALPGWDFYQFYGMVKGVRARYAWGKGSGHDGGRAIGFGEGRYPEMKAIIEMEKDRRYQLSFWYKTEKRERNSSFSIFSYEGSISSPRGIDNKKISRFFNLVLEPTGGEWKHYSRAIKPSRKGKYILQLAVYYQKAGEWAWFDDIEVQRMW